MRRAIRVGIVALIGVLVLLVWLRAIPAVALAVVEVAVMTVALLFAIHVWRAYRAGRASGQDGWLAFADGLSVLLPRPIASLVALEPLLWVCLFRWVARSRRSDAEAYGYARESSVGVFAIAVLFSAPVEILLFELLIPIGWLKVLALILSLYSVFWLLGFVASLHVRQHRLDMTGLHVYYGIGAQGFIPYAAIASVERERRRVSVNDGCHVDTARESASISVGNLTMVTLHLREPMTLRRMFDSTPPVTTLYLAVDEPERFVAALERRLRHDEDAIEVANRHTVS